MSSPIAGVWRLEKEASEPPTQLLLALGMSSTARDAAEKVDVTLVMRMASHESGGDASWVLEHHSILGRKRRRFLPAYGFVVREEGIAAGKAEHRLEYRPAPPHSGALTSSTGADVLGGPQLPDKRSGPKDTCSTWAEQCTCAQ